MVDSITRKSGQSPKNYYKISDNANYVQFPQLLSGNLTTFAFSAVDSIHYAPFYLPQGRTTTEIGIRVTALGASGQMRLGIYSSKARLPEPETLIGDSGTISTGATGNVSASLAVNLQPGKLYFMAFLAGTAVCTIRGVPVAQAQVLYTDKSNLAASANSTMLYTQAQAFGALPSSAGTLVSVAPLGGTVPAAWIGY